MNRTTKFMLLTVVIITGFGIYFLFKNSIVLFSKSAPSTSTKSSSILTTVTNSPENSEIKSVQVVVLNPGESTTLDFRNAQAINAANPSRVSPFIPTYAQQAGLRVKGSEINQNLKISVLAVTNPKSVMMPIQAISIGRYTLSDNYDGVVVPFCEKLSCNYSFGGINKDQAKVVINLKLENTTGEPLRFISGYLNLSSGEKIYKQWQIDSQDDVPPYSTTFTYLQADVPLDINMFTLEYQPG